MQNFTTALKAEHIKKSGTGIYVLSVLMGIAIPIIYAIVLLVQSEPASPADIVPYNYFNRVLDDVLEAFATFFFPLLIIITVSRITQLDHRNGGWQLMETQPVTKASIYFSKFTVLLISNTIAILSFILMAYICSGLLFSIVDLPKAATFSFEFGFVTQLFFRLFLAALVITALQYLISVLIPSFVWSILTGFVLLITYLFLYGFNVVPDWYPIRFLGSVAKHIKGSDLGYWLTYSEIAALLITLIIVYIGFNWYRHKSVKQAFFTKKRLAALACVLLVIALPLAWLLMPKTMDAYSKTIVSGTIDTKDNVRNIYILGFFIDDTIAAIPIVNNAFHYEIKQDIPADIYRLILDEANVGNVFFGKNDSINIAFKKNKAALDGKITGTRLAESQYKDENKRSYSSVSYYLQENIYIDNVDFITEQITNEWKEKMEESSKFKTADNHVPRPDFVQSNKKAVTITYLNYWQDFLKKRRAMFPGKATKESADIAYMKSTVPLDDDSMLSNEDYFKYVKVSYIENNKADIDESTKALKAIAALKPGTFKDKMLYWQLKTSVKDASAKSQRDNLIATYAPQFGNAKYQKLITGIGKTLSNLDKGMVAPAIAATTLSREPFALENFKGKYIAIDVWATWCAPCREESPYFDKLAIKYKNQPVQFVALSTDRRIDDWFVDATQKSKSVLQVHADNEKVFSNDYNVEFIPRFILIDKEGKIVNSKMPRPSDATFEQVLRQQLNLGDEK
ncbi:redoxin domain-containing protein [Flavobacterium zepuense]|uniref:Redoxin domain-containing protein n=1 Tax=Flavobacterium zepuense TaxID=2593302 RepID=A0A552V0G7_9FLAO|nr:redoxin family protein [Flavobacterium zepuense]TRW23966.1 redoxin domain-containing protein [Flavobacterium zepuense]